MTLINRNMFCKCLNELLNDTKEKRKNKHLPLAKKRRKKTGSTEQQTSGITKPEQVREKVNTSSEVQVSEQSKDSEKQEESLYSNNQGPVKQKPLKQITRKKIETDKGTKINVQSGK